MKRFSSPWNAEKAGPVGAGLRLPRKAGNLTDGKKESYQRLRPQARFGAQPPLKAAALGAEVTQEGFLEVNCRKAARDGGLGHSFLIISFLNFLKVQKTCSARRKDFFDTLRPAPLGPAFLMDS